MKTALLRTLVIATGLAGAAQAQAFIGWRIATNGWHHGVDANGVVNEHPLHRRSNDLDARHDRNPLLLTGTSAEARTNPAGALPSLRELASQPLAR